MPDDGPPSFAPTTKASLFRHNVRAESLFSAFNGIFLALILFESRVVALKALSAEAWELTVLWCAFPVGAFLGPVWAYLGRRWGMKTLVIVMMFLGTAPLLAVYWVEDAVLFTAVVSFSLLMNSAMRMGQASLYRVVYPERKRGRVLGIFTFWSYLTMVPTMLVSGWLLDWHIGSYRFVYPLGGLFGLLGCLYYSRLRLPGPEPRAAGDSLREGFQNVGRVLRDDRLYMLFQVAFFLTGGAFFLSGHVILMLTEQVFDFSALELSLVMNVIPQLLLALCSPAWGRLLDRIGIMHCRLIISILLSVSLLSHYGGLLSGLAFLMYFGSVLQGLSNGGGQLTWYLASSLLAPRTEDVPLYNGIHFVLNGVRGLALPWVGTQLFLVSGSGSVFVAVLFSLAGIPVLLRALALKDARLAGKPLWLRKTDAKATLSPEGKPVAETSPTSLSRTA